METALRPARKSTIKTAAVLQPLFLFKVISYTVRLPIKSIIKNNFMKTTQVLKSILFGVAIGAAIFFIPFPFRFFFGFFLLLFVLRIFAWGRWRRGSWKHNYHTHAFWNPSYTQRWKNMSDEERKSFIHKMEKELFTTNIAAE